MFKTVSGTVKRSPGRWFPTLFLGYPMFVYLCSRGTVEEPLKVLNFLKSVHVSMSPYQPEQRASFSAFSANSLRRIITQEAGLVGRMVFEMSVYGRPLVCGAQTVRRKRGETDITNRVWLY